jgi:hypothetical protein
MVTPEAGPWFDMTGHPALALLVLVCLPPHNTVLSLPGNAMTTLLH